MPAKLIIFLCFALLGLCVFSLSGGAIVFSVLLLRKNIENPPPRKRVSEKQAERESKLSAHLRDGRISDVIQNARAWWNGLRSAGKIEELSVQARRFCPPFKPLMLKGYLLLPANFERAADSRGAPAVILVHGYTDNAAGAAYLAAEYHKRGVIVLSIDCRAHGESGGEVIGMGYPDSKDLALWVGALKSRFGHKTRVILHGVSMGAAAVMQYDGAEPPAVIAADCGFSSGRRQFLDMFGAALGKKPVQRAVSEILFAGMSVSNFVMAGFFLSQNSPERALKKRKITKACETPLVLFHGSRDRLVSAGMLRQLVKASGGKNVIVKEIEDAPHMGCYFYAPELYMETVLSALH
ncbi:MAG: hypothetical protein Pg6C_00030 [Treponemataceae bacterium]|nr:MAG: hypothetical protein Pg6C_00030 [Treponemataceae bacterium]